MKTTKIQVRDVQMNLSIDTRSLELCARMNYETENLDFIDAMPDQSVFYDLGACEGRFSIYAALKGHQVFAFEPEAENYGVLTANMKLNELEYSMNSYQLGVGAASVETTMMIGQPWAGGHQKVVKHDSVRSDLDFDFKTTQTIQIVGLDEFIASNGLPSPQYLKVDIDGSEIPFVEGARKSIASASKIIFELSKKDQSYKQVCESLLDADFSFEAEYQVPNEPDLYNVVFSKK